MFFGNCTIFLSDFFFIFLNNLINVKKKLKKLACALLLSRNKSYLCLMEFMSKQPLFEMSASSVCFVRRLTQISSPQQMVCHKRNELLLANGIMGVQCVSRGML